LKTTRQKFTIGFNCGKIKAVELRLLLKKPFEDEILNFADESAKPDCLHHNKYVKIRVLN